MSTAKLLKKRGAKVKKLRGEKGPAVWRVGNYRRYATQLGYNDILTAESALGRTLFGPVPAGHRREFFTPRKNVWLWYESWTDAAGVWHDMTIRYEVRPAGVYKLPSGGIYTRLEGAELSNFATAVRSYTSLVKAQLYS